MTRPTASAARAEAATTMAAVLAALRQAGAGDRGLRTDGLALQPVMGYRNDGPPRLRGYELRNGVVARLRDLARLPGAIDTALGPVLAITEGSGQHPAPYAVARAAKLMVAEAAPTPVEAGESEIAVTVEVVVALA